MVNNSATFFHLRNLVLGEYNFIYRINDGYKITELSKFSSKHQLLFQKLHNRVQQMNLMLVDSVFPVLLADIVLEVFLNNVKSLKQYKENAKIDLGLSVPVDERYLKYKFKDFMELSLYSSISTKNLSNGEMDTSKVFCLKDSNGELKYYSIYERFLLFDLLVETMELKIDFKKSSIRDSTVNLCFKIIY
jgi:HpaII restriction endonuclease